MLASFASITCIFAQTKFPCNGDFLFTRQYKISTVTNTYISKIDFIPNDVNITNPGTISPVDSTNATVQYNGYVWTQKWSPSSYKFVLLKVAADYTTTEYIVTGMPDSINYNNAGVDKNGLMYILQNGTSPIKIFTIDLSSGTPTYVSTKNVGGLNTGQSVIWGDITTDPITNRVYAWHHPNPAATTNLRGLYELTGLSTASPTVTKIGSTSVGQDYIMGSLFFNDRGQLFGYGSATVTTGSLQDRFFAIDKATGVATQYGIPDLAVSQSDGCECSFRISMDRQVSTPILNIPKCSSDTFTYKFTIRNYTSATITNLTFSDTIDARLSYTFNPSTLQTMLQPIYGAGVNVALTNDGGGIKNVINITNMNVAQGDTFFVLPVLVDARRFASSFTTNEQAILKGIDPLYGGPNEVSNNPLTFNGKDETPITINLTGSRCLPPVANNFTNTPMPQGNTATAIPSLIAADPDGTISNYTLTSVPAASNGILSVSCPATPTGASCTGGFADLTAAVLAANPGGIVLTPAQIATLRFDPAANFVGDASFTFTATDNTGNVSNTATYILPVTAQPPVSNNLMENSMVNTNGATAIKPLNSADVDGTISTYQLLSLPTAAQGVLSVPCPPTFISATCTGGYQDLTAAVLANYPAGISLTPVQMAAMKFDPTSGYVGNATFNYNATDNSGNLSNTANYTIPVTATATTQRPPLANDIIAQPINNNQGPTAIPALKASDLDGTVVSYTISTLPSAAAGTLSVACPPTPAGAMCTGGFADLTAAVLAANPSGILLTPTQINSLRFDPTAGYVGTPSFTYTAKDNSNLVSNPAIYKIPVVNTPPVAVNINTVALFNGPATATVPLSGSDLDGTITSFTLKTVPTLAQGTLSVPCPATPTGASCTGDFANLTPAVLAANPGGISLTPAQAAALRFQSGTGFSGSLPFTYTTTDNDNLVSSVANYNITISNQAPVSKDTTIAALPNSNGPTAIGQLRSKDPDGTIASYLITSIPAATSGVLSIPCPATPTGATCTGGFADITTAVLLANPSGIVLDATQMAGMRFDPALNYTGVVNFTYSATDNSGNISNVATFNIPISGVGNLPPISHNIIAPTMYSSDAATTIPALVGIDPDGTVASYTLTSVPNAAAGILSVSCPATPTGASCIGGFANLTAAVLAANNGKIDLTAAQISTLRFDPNINFTGTASFSYYDTDNSGSLSNLSTYTIPVIGTPPVSTPIIATTMAQTNGPTLIPSLISADADGTVVSYQIDNLPPTSQGVLSVPCPVNLLGGVCVGGYQDLTAAVLANYAIGGIPLTPAQMAAIKFDPAGSFAGNVVFNYHGTDNSGLISNTTSYTIPVSGQPPVSTDILAPKLLNSSGPTIIPSLISNDPDGTISSYRINSIPPVTQGILSIPCPATPTGATCTGGYADITDAVLAANPGGIVLTALQMTGMRFDPDASFNGDVIFNYSAYDNNGNISNTATYLIPVGTSSVLPINKLNFTAVRNNKNIDVKWTTENEVNVNKYELYYSTDNLNYSYAASTLAKNLYANNYDALLNNFTNNLYYLKLKVINSNGTYTFSNIIIVRNNTAASISIFPNPVKDFANIDLGATAKGNYTIQLLDVSGKIIASKIITNAQANQIEKFEQVKGLSKGIYIVSIKSELYNTVHNLKLIIE
jgi:hypothetical protein